MIGKPKYSIYFVVTGNQEDPEGNPIPYFRTTQGSSWNKPSQRYNAWKDYVASHLVHAKSLLDEYRSHPLDKKPIRKGIHAKVTALIHFKGENHADPDNIVKGINDALFMDDKHVDVTTWHTCGVLDPRVEVKIEFYDL